MRRRPRAADAPGTPPVELLTFTGTTNRERFAWLIARQEWWDANHHPDEPGDLQWVIDGHDQVGDFPCCGSTGVPCDDPDCLCNTWSDYCGRTDRQHKENR